MCKGYQPKKHVDYIDMTLPKNDMGTNEVKRIKNEKDIALKYLEKMFDRMNDLEDMNYEFGCWNHRLHKDIEALERVIDLIKEEDN